MAYDVLPCNFTTIIDTGSRKEGQQYLVSLQSAKHFYQQIQRVANDIGTQLNHVGCILDEDNFSGGHDVNVVRRSQKNRMVYLKKIQITDQHVPNCSDFVVYLFKKESGMRVMRLYQCRCDLQMFPLQQGHYYDDKVLNVRGASHNEYRNLQKLIKNNERFRSVPQKLFSSTRTPCNKVFGSLHKLYAHLRIHSNEKPFICPVNLCSMGFNQRGNMQQHIDKVHPELAQGARQPTVEDGRQLGQSTVCEKDAGKRNGKMQRKLDEKGAARRAGGGQGATRHTNDAHGDFVDTN